MLSKLSLLSFEITGYYGPYLFDGAVIVGKQNWLELEIQIHKRASIFEVKDQWQAKSWSNGL